MKKISISIIICLVSAISFIACKKQSIDKEEVIQQTHTQTEISSFINKIEERGDNSAGEIVIYTNGKTPSEEIYTSKESEYSDILGPIVHKLSTNGVVATNAEDDGPHGSADCKYCSKLGCIKCGNKIASQIPQDVEEVHVTIGKKDKDGYRNIHAEW